MSKTYFVIGATGNTGHRVAQELAQAGHTVRGLTRNPAKAPETPGVTYVQGTLQDKQVLQQEFAQADAAYVMIPPAYEAQDFIAAENQMADTVKEALEASNLRQVVVLSSQGAHLSEGNGPIKAVHYLENRLKEIDNLNAVFLRPPYFYENAFGSLPLIQHQGIMGSAMPADKPIPMIATADIGAEAANRLQALDFKGIEVEDLLGPEEYTQSQVAEVIGAAVNKPELKYVQFPPEQARQGMIQSGMTPSLADLYVEMGTANHDEVMRAADRSKAKIGATTLEDFAQKQFKPVFEAQQQ